MIAPADQAALLPVLDDLERSVEDIVRSGLTTASPATREKIDVAFREASRLKIGRLAVSLRSVSDEVKRWLDQDPNFSSRRLALFVERSWILGFALARAIRAGDEESWRKLTGSPAAVPVASIEVVTLGVQKRASQTTVGFDFRMREVTTGRPVSWSFVANRAAGVVPEAYLHLPQPQKFSPKILCERTTFTVTQAALADGRLLLGPRATVTPGPAFTDWARFAAFDRAALRERLAAYRPGPLDLEVELQEEVTLSEWSVGATVERRPGVSVVEIHTPDLHFDVTDTGAELRAALTKLAEARTRPPLFGLLHFDLCRLVLTPLAVIEDAGPRQLMLSSATIDAKQLMATLKF